MNELKIEIQSLKSYTAKEILGQLIADGNKNILSSYLQSKPEYK
ncbi:MAG: hypothetical protein ABI462_10590 [Ignavibacteria bacterium]